VRFSVNGMIVHVGGGTTAEGEVQPGGDVTVLNIPRDDEIYPTLTLHSPNTQVRGWVRGRPDRATHRHGRVSS
jgi:hypothetical protein